MPATDPDLSDLSPVPPEKFDLEWPALTAWLAHAMRTGGRVRVRAREELVEMLVLPDLLQDTPWLVTVEAAGSDHPVSASGEMALVAACRSQLEAQLVAGGLCALYGVYDAAPPVSQMDLSAISDVRSEARVRTAPVEQVSRLLDQMSEDPDWKGQAPSVGFRATFDQELDLMADDNVELSLSPGSTRRLIDTGAVGARMVGVTPTPEDFDPGDTAVGFGSDERVDFARAALLTRHRQELAPGTGGARCICGQWEGPYTISPDDPRNFGTHLVDVLREAGLL